MAKISPVAEGTSPAAPDAAVSDTAVLLCADAAFDTADPLQPASAMQGSNAASPAAAIRCMRCFKFSPPLG